MEPQDKPLVTVIVPTIPSRSKLFELTLESIRNQDYPNFKTIVKSSTDISIGEKLNQAVEESDSEFYLRCDDDVWNAPDRISKQMDRIGKKMLCGTSIYYSHSLVTNRTLQISDSLYITYESMLFTKEAWKAYPFDDRSLGECNTMLVKTFGKFEVEDMKDLTLIVSMRHNGNVTAKCPPRGFVVDTNLVKNLIGNDLIRYKEST